MKAITRIPHFDGTTGKVWAKAITGIDTSKNAGFMYEGGFLNIGSSYELEAGSPLIVVWQASDKTSGVRLFRVMADGTLELVCEYIGKSWAGRILSDVRRLLTSVSSEIEQLRQHCSGIIAILMRNPNLCSIANTILERYGFELTYKG